VPGKDWSYPYYRDLSYMMGMGMDAVGIMTNFLARADDVNSGGRQMPQHYGMKSARVVSQSSPTGTQYLQAVGAAKGAKLRDGSDEVVYVSSGEGTTSQGDFHEALNWASRAKLPVIFCVQDNKYAISVHLSQQTGGSVYDMVAGYVNLDRIEVDGTNFFETHEAFRQGRRARAPGRRSHGRRHRRRAPARALSAPTTRPSTAARKNSSSTASAIRSTAFRMP
jgi:2-oxoisovalerate dehydrogenase E1 component